MHLTRGRPAHGRASLWLRVARLGAWAIGAVVTLPVLLAILFRTPIRRPIRTFNKHFLNPLTRRVAGSRGPYAAVHHMGRRSGKVYTTPVAADRISDGFLIPLVYGPDVDWAKNVLAAGHASIDFEGKSYAITLPRIQPFAEAAPSLRRGLQLRYRFYGVKSFLHVHAAAQDKPDVVTMRTSVVV